MLFQFVYFFFDFFFGNRKAFIGKNEKNRVLGYSGFFFSPEHTLPPPSSLPWKGFSSLWPILFLSLSPTQGNDIFELARSSLRLK